MPDRAIEHYLKSEELYKPLIRALIYPDEPQPNYQTEEDVRDALNRIYDLGKVVGRNTAVAEGVVYETDSLIAGWLRCVEAGRTG